MKRYKEILIAFIIGCNPGDLNKISDILRKKVFNVSEEEILTYKNFFFENKQLMLKTIQHNGDINFEEFIEIHEPNRELIEIIRNGFLLMYN